MTDWHQPLRDDVRQLGDLLGQVLKVHDGPELFDRVERVRALSKRAHAGDDRAFDELADLMRALPETVALRVARAFAHFLSLANIAEQHHRVRRRRDHAREPEGRPQRGSSLETLGRLRAAGFDAAALARAAASIHIELVLTAHPTEIVRRTLLQKHHRIARLLDVLDRSDLTPPARHDATEALQREIALAWQTDEVRHDPVSPLDEVRAGLVVFEESLWDAVPVYLRALDRALVATTGTPLPLGAAPIAFGSWIGGDRDGNRAVTPEVTRQAAWLARWVAADLYLREVQALRDDLSLTTATGELRDRAGGAREPYRALLAQVRDRLTATRAWAEAALRHEPPAAAAAKPYFEAADLAEPLQLCYRSLDSTGNHLIAAGRLTDLLRRVAVFGVTLARLDIRQEASRHADAVAWIARTRGWGAYGDASESDRQALLLRQLTAGERVAEPLPLATASDEQRDVIETFQMAAQLHPESLGAYVITMASAPSDVLAVELLQRVAAQRHRQRVVPLFETRADLHRAAATMGDLLAIPWYRDRIQGRQEIMVGYSDSSKEAGRFAAAWTLYRAQEEIVAACAARDVAVTLFHGRGGSIGRGGGPAYLAIQSQPAKAMTGSLRITEQGETIEAKFGLVDIAVRTLEVYTTATLDAMVAPLPAPTPEWHACLDRISTDATAAYRAVVYDTPAFVEYFHLATPAPELESINIGSRPARRPGSSAAVGGLRAIPWQFAWIQTRLLLPSWLGIDEALARAHARGEAALLREMYYGWTFFRSTLQLIAIALAEADPRIAAGYDRLAPPALRSIGQDLRRRYAQAVEALLGVTGQTDLLQDNPVLRRSIDVRNPYVDPINLVQVDVLRRMREHQPDPQLRHAFVVTVNGIAAGMRNTG
ncbi:MAG: phosphoenolpyruvate carboxylase [Acidobacteria bacterium]|nr:MAG: phosphoenolpyruvate carboxylase [Acidobacteriota bacterium]